MVNDAQIPLNPQYGRITGCRLEVVRPSNSTSFLGSIYCKIIRLYICVNSGSRSEVSTL